MPVEDPPREIEDAHIRLIWPSLPEQTRVALLQAAQLQLLISHVPPPSLNEVTTNQQNPMTSREAMGAPSISYAPPAAPALPPPASTSTRSATQDTGPPGSMRFGGIQGDPIMTYMTQMSAHMNEITSRLDDFTSQAPTNVDSTAATEVPAPDGDPEDEGRARGGHRGAFASRGRRARVPRDGRGQAVDADLTIAKKKPSALSTAQKTARTDIQRRVAKGIRILTGVKACDHWPVYSPDGPARVNANTGIKYFEVHFRAESGIDDPINQKLLERVSGDVEKALEGKEHLHTWLSAPDVEISQALVFEIAKSTFAGFKRVFESEQDEEKANVLSRNARRSRWQLRRDHKCQCLKRAVELYKEQHDGRDPTPLLDVSLMSDEASGPEEGSGETKSAWKKRMATHLGMDNLDEVALKTLRVFEVIRPNWRSEKYSEELRELRELYAGTLTTKQAQSMTFRVRNKGRATDVAPDVAPYDFGINVPWYERFKNEDTHRIALGDWGTYGNPDGYEDNITDHQELGDDQLPV